MRAVLVSLMCCVWCAVSVAQEEAGEPPSPLAGHSQHGEAFNEGPRQGAYLMGGTGQVHFPVTTGVPAAQAFFDQGVGQLHGFWYLEAERSFRQAATLDPSCAMAFWGMAMANFYNEPRAEGFARKAHEGRDAVSPRERMWIDALARYFGGDKPRKEDEKVEKPSSADRRKEPEQKRVRRFAEDLEEIVYRHPDDVEAKAFLVNQLWLNQRYNGVTITSRQANQALLDQVFARNPRHPAHHYAIHLWDAKEVAERSVGAAAASGPSAPDVAHQWHMASHTWWRLERHGDAAWSQEASARVDHRQMMRDGLLPDEIHNYAHNNEWLAGSLAKVGRVEEALDLAMNMIELPRHPRWNTFEKRGSAHYGRSHLLETLEGFDLWERILSLADSPYLEAAGDVTQRAQREAVIGMAHHFTGDAAGLERSMESLRNLLVEARTRRAEALDEAEDGALEQDLKPEAVTDALVKVLKDGQRPVARVRQELAILEGLSALREGKEDVAFKLLEKGKLTKTCLARLLADAGRSERALEVATEAVKASPGAILPLAVLAEIQHRCGTKEDAHSTFEKVRALSAALDAGLPPFRRLESLARACGHEGDWRIAATTPTDVGHRPGLDTLGPFRWSPSPAPPFHAVTGDGKPVALADYNGRPLLVVFFLGFDCLHCVEQLQALSPHITAFKDAGIDIVTLGTCTQEQIRTSTEAGAFPLPILADPNLTSFRRWRVFDDFEKIPLHGTFLLDASHHVRWRDIAFEPFMDIPWLLEESRRLLALPVTEPPAGASTGGSK